MAQSPKGRAVIEILLDSNKLEKQLKVVEDNFKRVGANITRIGAGFTGFGVGILGGLTVAANKAGDAVEIFSRFEAVFKGASKEVRAFAAEVAKSIGRAESEVANALSTYQSFFIGLGKGEKEATELSKKLTTLALDFASFNNLSDDDAQSRFLAGLSGSSEVFDKFGINIKAAALDQQLLQQGLNKTTATATENEKVMARLAIIMESLGRQGAIGDAVRTANSYNNVLKRLNASVLELQQAIGSAIIGDFASFNSKLSQSINRIKEYIRNNAGLVSSVAQIGVIATGVGAALVALGFGLIGIGGIVSTLSGAVSLLVSAFATLGTVASASLLLISSPLSVIAALVFSLLLNFGALGDAITDLSSNAGSELSGAFKDAKSNFDLLKQAVLAGDLKLAFSILATSIKTFFLKAFSSIITAYDKWIALTVSGLNNIAVSFQQAFLFIKQLALSLALTWSKASDLLADAFLGVLPTIQNLFIRFTTRIRLLWMDIQALFKAGIKFSKGDLSGAKDIFKEVFDEREKLKQSAEAQINANLNLRFDKAESDLTKTLKGDIDGIKKEIDRLEKGALDFSIALGDGVDEGKAGRDAQIKDLEQKLKFLGLVAKQTANKQLQASDALAKGADVAGKAFKSIVPKFGTLAEAGSAEALKLFSSNQNPMVKEQQQANKKLDQLIINTNAIEVR